MNMHLRSPRFLLLALVTVPLAVQAQVPFDPIQDLDASTGVSSVSGVGSEVTSWANQGEAGDDVTNVDGTITLQNAGLFDYVEISSSGGSGRLIGNDASAFDSLMNGGGHTIFAVVRPGTGANIGAKNAVIGTLGNSTPFSGIGVHVTDNSQFRHLTRSGSDVFAAASSPIDDGDWHILVGRLSAGTGSQASQTFVDGPTPQGTATPVISSATNSGPLSVGTVRTGSPSENYFGDIARILVYDRPLSDSELNTVGSTLANLYGVDDSFIGGDLPEITSFDTSLPAISAGQSVTLSWAVENSAGGTLDLAISPTVGDVSGSSSIQVSPQETTTYTLIAENANGSSSSEVTVTVDATPIISFSASDESIRPGEALGLSWVVSGAVSASIDNGIGSVAATGATTVAPTDTTTYTISASNANGSASSQVTIEVDKTPLIDSFAAAPSSIADGAMVTLSWDVSDADLLTIDQGVGDVTGQTSIQLAPASSTVYTLTASNSEGTSSASASVTVGETLTISEFMADNETGITDEDGEFSDWIEIHNTTSSPISLAGWYLTDDDGDLTKWQFPAESLAGGGYLIVYASGKNRAVAGNELHTNFKLSRGGEYLALVEPDGVSISRQYAPEYPNQNADISYGLHGASSEEGFFDPPTPGAANATGFLGFVDDTTFSVDRGYYEDPIQVAIATDTPGAEIRYTTDGSEPSDSAGTLYSGLITIDSTTVLRAIAYKTGFRPTDIDTQSYLYTADIRNQPEMDQDVVGVAPYNNSIEDDLKAIPALSLVLPNDGMFGSVNGIYANPNNRGLAWERAVSVEFFNTDKSEEFQVDAGVRIHGANARGHLKKPLRLYFRSTYGPGKLRYPLFPGEVEEFDRLILRSSGHEAWTSPFGSGVGAQAHSASYLRDQFQRQTHGEMGNLSPRGRHCHLYINGIYWGIYNMHERADAGFGEAHFGGDKEDYDAVSGPGNGGGGSEVVSGTRADWDAVIAMANGDLTDPQNYTELLDNIDINSLIDNMIVRMWAGDVDWIQASTPEAPIGNRNKNWYCVRKSRGDEIGKWQFLVWDAELSMGKGHTTNRHTNIDITDADINNSPARFYSRLQNNPEFRLLFADRLQQHFFNGGAMTPENNMARWNALVDQTEEAVVAESARWGDAIRSTPYTRDAEWRSEVDWIANTFMAGRTATVLNQFAAIGLFPSQEAPVFTPQHGGVIGGASIGFTPPASGTVYYTTDGSDPRFSTGGTGETELLSEGASGIGLVPSVANGGAALTIGQWTGVADPSNVAQWKTGATGMGFELTAGDYDPLIGIYVPEMRNNTASAYLRVPFNIPDQATLDNIATLTLRMRYDDGFVAYINGTQVEAANEPPVLDWQADATANHPDSLAVNPSAFDITSNKSALQVGTNILAIHALNDSAGSSDALVLPEIAYTTAAASGISPTAQPYTGNFFLPASSTVRARVFDNGEWSALNEATFLTGTLASASNTLVSEVYYNPPGESESTEYIELMNDSGNPVDFSLLQFSNGIEFTFPIGTVIPAGGYALVVADQVAFEAEFGNGLPVVGQFAGDTSLDNGGERITLLAHDGTPIESFRYNDKSPWPTDPDGSGASLTRVIEAPTNDPEDPLSWRPSTGAGSPGTSDATPFTGDPEADLDEDGLTAIVEYALGTSDTVPTSLSDVFDVTLSPLGLSIEFQRDFAAEDASVQIEHSSDLGSWSPVEEPGSIMRQENSDGSTSLSLQYDLLALQRRGFWRLTVSSGP